MDLLTRSGFFFLGIWRLKLAVIYSEFNQLLMTLISFKLSGLAMKCLFVFEVWYKLIFKMFFILKCKKIVFFFFNFCFNININSKIKKKFKTRKKIQYTKSVVIGCEPNRSTFKLLVSGLEYIGESVTVRQDAYKYYGDSLNYDGGRDSKLSYLK